MNRTIKWQFIFSFVSISFIIIGAFSIMTLSLMDNHFAKYVAERQESEIVEYTTSLERIYEENEGWPNTADFESIGLEPLHNLIILKVYDNEKAVLRLFQCYNSCIKRVCDGLEAGMSLQSMVRSAA